MTSVYNKLNGFEPETTAKLVRDNANEIATLVLGLKAQRTPLLSGYTVKMLDGNCIVKTEHRLEALRHTKAGPLPGKSLVVYDHSLDMAIDMFSCEDGHAQERSLLSDVLPTVKPNDVWVADRNFCVQHFLSGIDQSNAFFIIRRHKQFPLKLMGEEELKGEIDTGTVYEQDIMIKDADGNHEKMARLISITLKNPTRDGHKKLSIVSNLPKDISAVDITNIYRDRWSIETMFLHLTSHLHSEINTLGYPRAALFGFSLALMSYNILSLIKAAMRSVHNEEIIEKNISGYYISGEIARTVEGMNVALPEEEWIIFQTMPEEKFIQFLKELMENVVLSKYTKSKRGVKKPKPKRNQYSGKNHVSTFKLLNGED